MKFEEFRDWCNERACDGVWGMDTAFICIDIMTEVNSLPKRKQEKAFQEAIKDSNLIEIINMINERIGDPKRYSKSEEIKEEEKESFFKKLFKRRK